MPDQQKNLILLSADALRADHLSCYGYHRETSPALDKLASEGIQFENAYSASSHTREAVPALLTGEYPDVAIDNEYKLATDTIACTLSQEGFATGGFHSNPFISRAYGFDRGFDQFYDDLHLGKHKLIALAQRAVDKLRNRHYARAEEINNRSLKWIDSLEDDRPFFLWNHYMDTHGPYEPPREYATLYRDTTITDRKAQSLYQRAIKKPETITETERQLLIDLYDAEIRYNDQRIGNFLEELRNRNLIEQSIIIFTSDHGDAFGEHGYYEHPRYLHEEITHVPLIVSSTNSKSQKISTAVSTLDICETIYQICKDTERGFSLIRPCEKQRTVFSQARGEKSDSKIRRYASRDGDGACFCELDIDSGNLDFQQCASKKLQNKLREHAISRNSSEKSSINPRDNKVSDEIERRLDALGYK